MDQGNLPAQSSSEGALGAAEACFYAPMPLGRPSQAGEPTWELAGLFPQQGKWTEQDFLELDRSHRRLYELVDGTLEILAMPSLSHQEIVFFLAKQLDAFVRSRQLGKVLIAPCPVRLELGHFREPDLFFVRSGRLVRDDYPEGADLVMEVVSPGERDRKRDLEIKPVVYAKAGIPEYWIIDPQEQRITVLFLEGAAYRMDGTYAPGQTARSVVLPDFVVHVSQVFTAGG